MNPDSLLDELHNLADHIAGRIAELEADTADPYAEIRARCRTEIDLIPTTAPSDYFRGFDNGQVAAYKNILAFLPDVEED